MAYNTFTMSDLETRLGLTLREVSGTFDAYPDAQVSAFLQQALERGLPIATGIGREKARSEGLIYPILTEVRELLSRQISVFSGPKFNVDRKQGLVGYLDFLLASSPMQLQIVAPVVAVVEAKHEDLTEGIPQAIAAMYAARLFNTQHERVVPTIYGVTTSGTAWRFLRLSGTIAELDLTEYHIREVGKILGILTHIVHGKAVE
jgi:hypothetical protein